MTSQDPTDYRRVLFVTNGLTRGGAETQLVGVIRAAKEHGHEVALAVMNPGNDYEGQLAKLGVPVWLPADGTRYWDPAHLLRLARMMRRWRPDVTVTFLFQATLFMRMTNLVVRPRRRISSMRNDHLESRLREVLYRASCRADDHIVVNSRTATATLQDDGVLPRDPARVSVIYNGIDADGIRSQVRRTRSETRAELGVDDDEVLVIGVGRLAPQKNWPLLLDALATPAAAHVRLVVAGEGDLLESLQQQVRRLDLGARVQFLGLRDDVPDLVAATDRLVLSSRYEGTPNVVLEALALGVPVIATDVGACVELLVRPEDVVVPQDDRSALSAALGAVRAEVRPVARGGDGDPMAAFTWQNIGAAWVDLINNR